MTFHRVPAADSTVGKLIVVRAEFGDLDSGNALDVTAKVIAMVRDNSPSADATPANFGNPPGTGPRKLKVGYTIDGIYRSKTVDEGETLDISTRLVIRKAVYGKLPEGPSADVTDEVAALVSRNTLSVKATNENFGDAAQGVVKSLRVDYTFDGVEKSKTVNENQTLTISGRGS